MTGKVPITLSYRKPGTQPPLFVAGTFTEPPWTAQEMSYTIGSDGEHAFSHTCKVEPGSEIQYKFRVGTGNWWALNEDAPTVTDSAGNQNNVLKAPSLVEVKKLTDRSDVIANGHQNGTATTEPTEHEPVSDGEYIHANHGSTDDLLKNSAPGAPATDAAASAGTAEQDGPENNTNARAADTLPTSDGLPPLKGDNKKSWFATIIRTFFVEWIGGIFRRLFGRRRVPQE
ncbi:hypothetical protein SAPIO_CDS5892 [Scedosporium apiospermum]|uniref:AMP-activated protein kinase glycogen-binding domain-containing protein n=1 Tax=Pseudallescheria apiosperma TaxID=563466 RepID=A0A084G5M7_PSEDA|nr:uncharacterized protein SAPIO_CDS5892 [Scedosporium apiospermum]KEZ42639.1 hypothetical protein SAPIO_CDS5892 [Scedosporium apiospermum]